MIDYQYEPGYHAPCDACEAEGVRLDREDDVPCPECTGTGCAPCDVCGDPALEEHGGRLCDECACEAGEVTPWADLYGGPGGPMARRP